MHTVPRQEIHQRIGRFQKQLAARQLDGAFILQNADLFSPKPASSDWRMTT